MKSFFLLSFSACTWLLTQLTVATHNDQDGVFLHKQLKEIESSADPQYKAFVDLGYAINSLANQAKHPKEYEYANFAQSLNVLGRDADPAFYDRAQEINRLASEAKHRK